MQQESPMRVRTECRACGSTALSPFFDAGDVALANSFLRKEDLGKPEATYPLAVLFCENCSFVQLSVVVRPDILFRNYIYFSSGVRTVPEHFAKYAEEIASRFTSSPEDLVVELGSNDGVLLGEIAKFGRRVLGVDPAENVAAAANARGVPTLPEFWSEQLALAIKHDHGAAKVVVGNNVVAHVDDLHDLLRGVAAVLADDGVFMFEAPYLKDMFDNLTFDTIYHEHLSYLAVRPLIPLLRRFGLEIFDVQTFPVQGNSIRVYASKRGAHPVQASVARFVAEELRAGLDKLESYRNLEKAIFALKGRVRAIVGDAKRDGKTIAAYGAPAKGNTLLSYFGIGSDVLDYATEELPSKVGLFTPGTHIPVVHIETARKHPPDYYLMLAWNTKDAILRNERNFRTAGGKFIMPVGTAEVI